MNLPSSISTRLHYQHKVLIDIIDGLTDEKIRRQLISGKWSVFENIVHLQTYQHVFNKRIRQMLAEKNPVFGRYSAEADPMFLENCSMSTREIIQDLLSTRKDMLADLSALLPPDLNKSGIHPAFGQMDLLQWMNFFLLHEAHHLFTIFKLGAALKNVETN
jgi:uncharacterized damage-inducible protein DinB